MSETLRNMRKEFEEDYMEEDTLVKFDCHEGTFTEIKQSGVQLKQIGGNHYLNKIQPWDIIDSWELNFYEGNILKYLLRDKNDRIEDLKKLIHYAEKLLSIEEGS